MTDPLVVITGLEKQLTDLREAAEYLMAIYVPRRKGRSPRSSLLVWMRPKVR
jgi:hypothetical protein